MYQNWITTSAGISMPRIIYGTAWKKERTADMVVQACKAGFRGIDTAGQPKHYNEPLVGEALQILKASGIERNQLYVQTKFTSLSGQDPTRIPYNKYAELELQVAESFDSSIRNLQTDYVDCFILHSPMNTHSQTMKAWKAMESIKYSGGARQLGISNCYDIDLFSAIYNEAQVKPAILQNRFYKDTGYDTALRQWCTEHDVIYESFWTLTANPHILSSKVIQDIAQRYDRSEAQILFRFLSQSSIVPLTGSCSELHIKQDLSIFEFELLPEELASINCLLI